VSRLFETSVTVNGNDSTKLEAILRPPFVLKSIYIENLMGDKCEKIQHVFSQKSGSILAR
jgi:hypothetical protein